MTEPNKVPQQPPKPAPSRPLPTPNNPDRKTGQGLSDGWKPLPPPQRP